MKLNIYFLALSLCIISCKTQSYTLSDYEGPIIAFGKSGGFAGAIHNFKLLENGQLFKSSNGTDYNEVAKLNKKVVKQMFNNYELLNLKSENINDPGNMTYFVAFENGRDSHKLVWGGTAKEVSPIIMKFFTTLMQLSESDNKN